MYRRILFMLFAVLLPSCRAQTCTDYDLRLVGGQVPNEGRVEICVNQQWGTVCDDFWGDPDAEVVCRQLGYPPENADSFQRAHFGEGSGEIFLDDVACRGSESRLIDCSHPPVGVEDCRHHEDASVRCAVCHNGEIRLVGGAVDWEGRVEVCINNDWNTVCDDRWGTSDAGVACRQLGYSRHNAIAYQQAHFGQGNGPIGLDEVACSGSERGLVYCSYDSHTSDCSHSEDAGVRCQPELLCEDGDIRIRDGRNPYQGRVEVCFNETWGTVCNDLWENADASVACRQLGFPSQNAVAILHPALTTYSQGTGPIFLDNVACSGGESRLIDCTYDDHTSDCSHIEDAGITCQPQCQPGDIRLAGSSIPGRGRVEVCVNGLWGTVCDDGWGSTDASVVCKQLNYSRHNATALSRAHFGPGSLPILMRNVGCSGSEEKLTNCPFSSQAASCSHSEDAGVQCQIQHICQNGDIRITGGTGGGANIGRVEVCFNETWGTVCNDHWNNNDAIVACRQLGYPTQGAVALTTPGVSGYSQGTGPIFLDNTMCDGTESRLIDCTYDSHTADCSHLEDAGVQCEFVCQTGSIRLVGGQTRREGRVEVCVNQMWGTVCDDDWDAVDARVACMQLGYSPTNAIAYMEARFGQGVVPIVLDNVACQGSETRLIDCSYDGHTADCRHAEDAGIQCQSLCRNGDIRLVGGGSQREGRVEVCMDGGWGTVCADDLWDATDATVVCRQLGFSRYGAETRSNFEGGSGLIHLNDVRCDGTESGLLNCQYNPNTLECSHAYDAGIYCRPLNCSNGDVRLVGGLSEFEGRVEVCWNETWGTVCDDFWSGLDARVVCRQLGYAYTDAESFTNAHFGQGSGPILLDNVLCRGSEQSLISCQHRGIGNENCDHNEDAGIRCRQCVENSLRLVGGSNQYEGRVEICLSGRWGTVCDDSWGINDARVVCKQLGHQEQGAQAFSSATFGQGTVPIIMTNVMCSGTESQLAGCTHDGVPVQGCSHSKDAGVRCLNVPGSPQTVSVTSLNPSSLTVSWTSPPANQLFGPLIGYNVSCSAQGLSHIYETPNNSTFSRLVNGLYGCVNYTCCVSAVSVVGEGSKKCKNATTQEDIPSGAPQNFVAYATSPTSLFLSWNAPLLEHRNGCIQQYRVYVTERETGRAYHTMSDTSSQTATDFELSIPSLHPYYQYDCKVAAITTGEGPSSQTVTARTFSSPPTGPPENIIASESSRSISLEWDLPRLEDRNGIITNYVIRVTNIRTSVESESTTSSTSYTVGSLSSCTTYSVVIAARNVNGTGPFSAINEVQTAEDVPSEPPQGLSLQASNSTTLRISWSAPLSENCQIRHYKINIVELDTGAILLLNSTSTSITVPSLHPFYQYKSKVAAFTIGVGPYSSARTIRMPEGIPSGPPRDFEVTHVSVASVSLAWNSPRPEHRNGLITGYVVNVMGGAESYQLTTTASPFTVDSLSAFSVYSLAVAARTSVGTGPFSMTITITTTSDLPSKPQDFTVANISNSSTALLLSWSVPEFPNGVIGGYITRITEEQTGRQLEYNSTSLTLTVSQLHPYYIYHCKVAAFNSAGLGVFTRVISARTPPDVPGFPRSLTAIRSCPPSITLNWAPPLPFEQNGIIINYHINARTVERAQTFQWTTASTSYTVPDVAPYTTYIFEVAASTIAGQGAFSMAVETKTCETPSTHAPLNITEEERGATSFRISWLPPPEEHHNGVIQHYAVNITEVETGRKLHFTTESTQITVTDLHPYYIYNCSVSAVTVAESPHSANIGVQTREAAPSGPPINLRVNTDERDPNSLDLTWNPPRPEHRNGNIRRYEISIVRADSTQEEFHLNSSTNSFKVRGLRPYTTYRCRVAAYTVALGPYTAEIEETTPQAPPTAPPQGVTASPQDPTTLVINWQPPPVEHRNGIIVEYTIRVTEIATGTTQEFSTGGTAIQLTVHSLHPFYSYMCRVAATTVDQGPFSTGIEVMMPESAPGAPRNPQHEVLTGTSCLLSWELPRAEDQNGIIRRYVIVLIEVNSTGTEFEIEAETTSKLLDFLRPFTEYRYRVAAVTVRIGNYTEFRNFMTPATPPDTAPSLTIEKFEQDPRTILLSWLPPLQANGIIQDYVVNVTGLTRPEIFLSYVTTDTTFTVTALHPYHRYLCAVAARTSAGRGPFNTQAVQLPEDVPSGPPLNLMGSPQNSRALQLEWQAPAPELQNGILREYKINITELETGRVIPQQTSTVTSVTVQSLHPYYHYKCSVAAYTIGVGPYATTVVQLPSDVPTSPPENFVSESVLPTSVTFSWAPPPAEDHNGLIAEYVIRLVAIKTGELLEVFTGANSTRLVYDTLRPESAYRCSIAARTDAVGTGPFTDSILVITPPDVPADAPRIGIYMRISATSIRLSWQPLTPEESRGTISMYHVKYRPLARVTRRSLDDMSVVINTTDVAVTITDLDPRVAYAVAIAASTSAGMGNYSNETVIGLYSNSLFQLHLTGAVVCQEWLLNSGPLEILDDISQDTARELEDVCRCSLSAKFIGDGRLHCDSNRTDAVVLQARMISTETRDSSGILSTLQEWAHTSPTLVARGVQLMVRADCSVELEEFDSSVGCVQLPTAPPSTQTPMTPESPTTPQLVSQQSGPATEDMEAKASASVPIPAIAGAVSGVLVVVIIVILLVLLYRRKRSKSRIHLERNFSRTAGVNLMSTGVYEKPYEKPPLPKAPAMAAAAGSTLESVLDEPIYEPIPGEEEVEFEKQPLPGSLQQPPEHVYHTTSHKVKPTDSGTDSGYDYASTFRCGAALPKETSSASSKAVTNEYSVPRDEPQKASSKAVANGYAVPRKTRDEPQKASTEGQGYSVLDVNSLPTLQYSTFGPGGAVPNPYEALPNPYEALHNPCEALPTHTNPSYSHFDGSSGLDSRREDEEQPKNDDEYIVMRRQSES